jgi:hypothetical protein
VEAHFKHASHVRDAGGVEAQWLVERRRFLSSKKGGMRCGTRCGPEGVWSGAGGASGHIHGESPNQGLGAEGARAERT